MRIVTLPNVYRNVKYHVTRFSACTIIEIICALTLGLGLTGCADNPVEPTPTTTQIPFNQDAKPVPIRSYTVMPGDGLYAVASKYGLDYRQVAAWNDIKPPYRLHVGQVLRLYPGAPTADQGNSEPLINSHTYAERTGSGVHPIAPSTFAPEGPLPPDHIANNWIWPTKGRVVQTFQKGDRTRQGIRIAGEVGQSIIAAESGKVIFSGNGLPGYGQLVIIKHAKNYLSAYGFNSKLLVQEGNRVSKGYPIAEMGLSTDGKPLLHFEIRRGDVVLNPIRLLPPR